MRNDQVTVGTVIAALCAVPHVALADNQSGPASSGLEEVLVTAQKREEKLQDTPVPVSVLNADDLASSGQVLLRDYSARVPGFRLSMNGSTQFLAVRGITTGGGSPTVGVVIDEALYGGSTTRVSSSQVADIDPGDLQRIEVLRGPQGTLYGAASMGGLVKFVTKEPSLTTTNGRIEAGVNSVRNGDGPGYSLRGSVNAPLSETWAIRGSAFTRQDAGYIDNPTLGRDGVNEQQTDGARVATLWRPSDKVSLKLSAAYQQTEGDGQSSVYALPGLGKWERNDIAGVGDFERKTQAYSALLDVALGSVQLTSVSAFNATRFTDLQNYSFAIPAATTQARFGVTGAGLYSHFVNDRFVQEIRFAGALGSKTEWLAGVFYDHESGGNDQKVFAINPTTGVQVGQFAVLDNPGSFEEYAAFANLTYHFTDRFQVQVGGRQSYARSTGSTLQIGVPPVVAVSPTLIPEDSSKDSAFTYLLTPRFKLNDDLMIYARLASGYRPGGFNRTLPNTPREFDPDKTMNYEIGLKGEFLDHRLSIDTSVYYIDWKDMQIQLVNPAGFNYLTNGSRAKSEGVELSVEVRPLDNTTVSAWVAYDNAELTEAFPATSTAFGRKGSPLPLNSEWSGNFSVQQNFYVTSNVTGFVEGTLNYVGERTGLFRGAPGGVPLPRDKYPSYTQTNLRAGFERDSWSGSLFINNLTDRRGVISGGAGFFPAFSYFYIQPRTIGLNVVKTL